MHSFLVLGANTPWVYALGETLSRDYRTHVVRIYDWFNYRRLKPAWPNDEKPGKFTRSQWLMPPGYAGRLELLTRPILRQKIHKLGSRLEEESGTTPWIIVNYPWLGPALQEHASRVVYYNLDDYEQYRPERSALIRKLEGDLMRRSALTLCLSQHQVDRLQQVHPGLMHKPVHFPLGVSRAYLNPRPESVPGDKTVGYIGNLQERIDWAFVFDVASRCGDVTFVFIGRWNTQDVSHNGNHWTSLRKKVAELENVTFPGPVAQNEVAQRYSSFGVNWIPYDRNNSFNIASCPTKIMDGLASGRPLLSTDIPECRLYPDWITIAHSPAEACEQLYRLFDQTAPDPGRAQKQVDWSENHTWETRAKTLVRLLEDLPDKDI